MKKSILLSGLLLMVASLCGCGDNSKTIRVGASPSPHADILNSSMVKQYVESKGYNLKVIEYQDYVTPNKALNDEGIDANYFQHIPYLNEEVSSKNYQISPACTVHYEPLNLYAKNEINDYTNKKISIVNDVSNVERALALLKANSLIDDYNMEGFNAQRPNDYVSGSVVTLECIDPGLLANKVNDDGIAIIPGNYALNAWGASLATTYKRFGETKEVAGQKANIIAVKTINLQSEKTKVLCEALAQESVKTFIEDTYGPTVVYSYEYLG